MAERIGFIGLGIMGRPMARNLMKAGYQLVLFNRSPGPVEELAAEGGEQASGPADLAGRVDIVITMLPDSPDVESILRGLGGVLEGARPGSVLIDMSSIDPIVSRELASEASSRGLEMLDAPVSGGEPGAKAGTLAIMVGGAEGAFERCRPVLDAMGRSVVRVGEAGAGQVAKLANQIIVALNIEAIGEALVFATRAGVDPEAVFQAIRSGLAGSNVLDAKAPMILERDFRPGFRIKLHRKDLDNALAAGASLGVPLPATAAVRQAVEALMVNGRGEEDHAAIVRVAERLAGVEIGQSGE